MKNISCWIIDDEIDSQELISGILKEFYPQVEILGYSVNIDDAFEQIKKMKPQIVFLDINLPRGSGINLLERFPIRKFEVIVISGYPENESKLKRFRDIPFLAKPYNLDDFKQLADKAINSLKEDPYKVHRYS